MTKLNHPVILTIKNFNKSALCVKRLSFFVIFVGGSFLADQKVAARSLLFYF